MRIDWRLRRVARAEVDGEPGLGGFAGGDCQHRLGHVDADDVVSQLRQQESEGAGPATEVSDPQPRLSRKEAFEQICPRAALCLVMDAVAWLAVVGRRVEVPEAADAVRRGCLWHAVIVRHDVAADQTEPRSSSHKVLL